MAENEKKVVDFDLIHFITYPDASGIAWYGQVCGQSVGHKVGFSRAYGFDQCNGFHPPQPIDCTVTNRIALMAQVSIIITVLENDS